MAKKYWDYTVHPGEELQVEGEFFDAEQQPVTIRITGAPQTPWTQQAGVGVAALGAVARLQVAPGTAAMVDFDAHLAASPVSLR